MTIDRFEAELNSIVAEMPDQVFVGYLEALATDLEESEMTATAGDVREAAKRIELWSGFKCLCGSTTSYDVCSECGHTYND
ncbi:MAG: hypothetical protein O7D34_02130 [Ignavibacteria bacterium]|nr:hypothetical protein [Ignavibacteria bacterium]